MCFFFNDTATTEIYTLSLHDALPILGVKAHPHRVVVMFGMVDVHEVKALQATDMHQLTQIGRAHV